MIQNEPICWLVDTLQQKEPDVYTEELTHIIARWQQADAGYLSLLIDTRLHHWLIAKGFYNVSRIVEYTRDLQSMPPLQVPVASLAERKLTVAQYKALYERCRSGSANKNTPQPIDSIFHMLEKELGEHWQHHCYYFTEAGVAIGITIPHIELGTKEEGRLFYFGIVPEKRGSGISQSLHHMSLQLLKQQGATYYVGSTDIENKRMIRLFEKNGCKLRDEKGIYKLEK